MSKLLLIKQIKGCAHFVTASSPTGKLEGDVNSWVCDEVTVEALGLAASLLAETGLAEIVEDPLISATATYYCKKQTHVEVTWDVFRGYCTRDFSTAVLILTGIFRWFG